MKLGILVNTDKYAEHLVGLADAAVSKGHNVIIFMMDAGVKLLLNPSVTGLCNKPRIQMSFCDYSTQKLGVSKKDCPDKIVCGSQYDNATMNKEADRVIIL